MRVRVCVCARVRPSAHAYVVVPSVRLLVSALCTRGHRARACTSATSQMCKRLMTEGEGSTACMQPEVWGHVQYCCSRLQTPPIPSGPTRELGQPTPQH